MPKLLNEQDRETMRQQIIRAACEEFAQIGYEQSKIESIAERANVGKGTVYLYFQSKQELFTAMLQEIGQQQLQQLREALRGKTSIQQSLETLLQTFDSFIQNQPDSVRIFISALYGVNRRFMEEAAVQRRQLLQLIETMLEQARKNGDVQVEPEPAALVILNICQAIPLLADGLGFGVDYAKKQRTQLVNMLLCSLKQNSD